MKEKTAVFIGHRDAMDADDERIRDAARALIEIGVSHFLNGGMGVFDRKCARIVYELKVTYPQVVNEIVIPYLSFKIVEPRYFDRVTYPEGFENMYFKRAITERNKYMVEHSGYAICFVRHDWGGAARTHALAVKRGLRIIDVT